MSVKIVGIGSSDLAVGVFDDGRVAWSMPLELEERIWFVIKHFCSDDEIFDGLAKARHEAGLCP